MWVNSTKNTGIHSLILTTLHRRRSLPTNVVRMGKQVEILPMLTAVSGRASREVVVR